MSLEPVILNEVQLKSAETQAKIDTQTQSLIADNTTIRNEINAHASAAAVQTITDINSQTATKLAEQTTTLQQTVADSEEVVTQRVIQEAARVIDSNTSTIEASRDEINSTTQIAKDEVKSHVTAEADRVIANSSGGSSSSVMIGQGVFLPEAGLTITHSSMNFLLSGAKMVNPSFDELDGLTSPYLGQLDYTSFDGSAVFIAGYFSDNLKIVAGDSGSYFISKDGGEFIRHSPNGTSRIRGVAVSGDTIHLCGDNGYYATSTDGEVFNSIDLGFGSNVIYGVLCNEHLTVVYGVNRVAYKRTGDEDFTGFVLTGSHNKGDILGNKVLISRLGNKQFLYTDDGFVTHSNKDLTPSIPVASTCQGVHITESNVYIAMRDTNANTLSMYKLNNDLNIEKESTITSPPNTSASITGFKVNQSIFCSYRGSTTSDSAYICEYNPSSLSLINEVKLAGFTNNVQGIENYGKRVVALGFDATATSAKAAGFSEYQPNLYMRYE